MERLVKYLNEGKNKLDSNDTSQEIKEIAKVIAKELYGTKSISNFSFFKFYGNDFIGLPTLQLSITQVKFLLDIIPTSATIGISPLPGSPELCIRFTN